MSNKLNNIKKFEEFVSENVWLKPSFSDIVAGGVKDLSSGLLDKAVGKVKSVLNKDDKAVVKGGLIGADKIARYNNNPEEFKSKLISISKDLRINPNWLLLTMIKESDLDPKKRNPHSSASGLIQFMDSTARDLGTTINSIRSMNGVEQLDYVYKYYKPYAGKMNSAEDVYLVTFMPGFFSSRNDNSKNLGGSRIASLNSVIDLNHDGQIKMGEFKEYVTKNIPSEYKDAIKSTEYTA